MPKELTETSLKPETCGKNAGVTPKAEIQMSDIPHTGTDQQRWNSWFNALQHAEVFAQNPGKSRVNPFLNPDSSQSPTVLDSWFVVFTYSFRIAHASSLSSFSCFCPLHVYALNLHTLWILRMGFVGGPFLELANMLDATQWMVWGGGMLPFLKRAHTVEICMQWMWWGGADVITVLKLPHSRRWRRSLNLIADMIMVDATQRMVWGVC